MSNAIKSMAYGDGHVVFTAPRAAFTLCAGDAAFLHLVFESGGVAKPYRGQVRRFTRLANRDLLRFEPGSRMWFATARAAVVLHNVAIGEQRSEYVAVVA